MTEEYPPYNYQEGRVVTGIAVDILQAIAADAGTTISPDQFRVMSWEDAYNAALSIPDTVVFSTVRLPEREDDFKWVGPIAREKKVLFAVRPSSITVAGPADLKNYTIGVVPNDAAIGQLKEIGVPQQNLLSDPDPAVIIEGLQEGTIDLWCYGEDAGEYFAEKTLGSPDALVPVYTLDAYDLYYAFNRNTPDDLVDAFQQGLDSLKQKDNGSQISVYEEILSRYS
ncbi:substrate-binding periplasmic protein [Methanofollis fontis]|uniref:substrate-binding periplasmic protein n=1 Tax=Methanofollis fontis TaxID=2052832 RepID=UPI0013EEA0E7|nr:transporter substrate-binding domain-containing protein [Methanofollis fontis]